MCRGSQCNVSERSITNTVDRRFQPRGHASLFSERDKTVTFRNSEKWLIVLAVLSACLLPAESFAQNRGIKWRDNPQQAQWESRRFDRPLLIYVGADFCGYCRKLEHTTWQDDAVARAVDLGYIPLKLDHRRHAAVVQQMGVQSFPTIFLISPAGELIAAEKGYRSPARMKLILAQSGVAEAAWGMAGR